jgi:phosphohistidine phosphatase
LPACVIVQIMATRQLLLLRHAKSSHDDPELTDHDRPLAPRGKRASAAMAAYMRDHDLAPALVLCSSAIRARQTLDGVTAGLGDPDVQIESELYEASADGLLERLRRLGDEVPSAMLIGHNPAIERLALDLAASGPDLADLARKYPTGALAVLGFDGAWGDLDADGARLVAFVKPRRLG